MSATVPMELNFGSGGNLKSVKRLRDLDLKDNVANRVGRPVRPTFANTGQIVQTQKGYRAGPINPKPTGFPSPIGGRSSVPPPVIQGLAQQGNVEGGGTVVPEQVARDIQSGVAGKPVNKSKISSKGLLIGGGVVVTAIIVAYVLFFRKKSRKKRKK